MPIAEYNAELPSFMPSKMPVKNSRTRCREIEGKWENPGSSRFICRYWCLRLAYCLLASTYDLQPEYLVVVTILLYSNTIY